MQLNLPHFILSFLLLIASCGYASTIDECINEEGDTTLVNQFFGLFAAEEGSDIPEAQRSKRKQVDELLKALTKRDGQLQFNGVATASFQVEPQSHANYQAVGSFDIFAFTSFGQHTILFFDLEAIGGDGPDQLIPNLSGLNADAGSTQNSEGIDQLVVLEAWAEFRALKDIFTINVGKIDVTNYFDNNLHANDETSQFLSGAFVNSAALPAPINAPGVRFRTSFVNRFYLQLALSSLDNSGNDLMRDHFKIAETGFKLFPQTGWEANFRFYGFEHPAAGHSRGFGLSFDELIAGRFTVFGRYAKNEKRLSELFGIEQAWSAGVGFKQLFLNREFKVGLAFGETKAFAQNEQEKLAELYISNQFNQWVFLSPHLQWIDPMFPAQDEHMLLGLRINFSY
ncbi:hypothetical protein [uncultured Sunxiuqinia sp.]|uniref:hypothetical protein n=1 Tax=uncultured Sunxiuqinia sp. TaxID=1573825 RepID=UPI002AA81C15|nr:hypothetical protein [uncultured Sunxiuqinia sp.]